MQHANKDFYFRDVHYPKVAVVPDQATAARKLAQGVIVLVKPAGKPKLLRFYCPCGCGETITINVMEGLENAWEIIFAPKRGISLWPSVWLDAGCKSHFILRNNTARMFCGRVPKMSREEVERWWTALEDEEPPTHQGGFDLTA